MANQIRYIRGDIIPYGLYTSNDTILHVCNCFNVMGAGLAKQLADRFPGVKAVDDATAKGTRDKLGHFSKYVHRKRDKVSDLNIYNLYAQYKYGRNKVHLELEALKECFIKVASDNPNGRYLLPKLGAGLAGGNWEDILPLVEAHLLPSAMSITVVEYVPDMLYLLVAGSRSYRDYDTIYDICNYWYSKGPMTIISGAAQGPDDIGLDWAATKSDIVPLKLPALWKSPDDPTSYIKSAGYIRNVEMGTFATRGAIFYDELTNGSSHMEAILSKRGVPFQNYGKKTCPSCNVMKPFNKYRIAPPDSAPEDARFYANTPITKDDICLYCLTKV